MITESSCTKPDAITQSLARKHSTAVDLAPVNPEARRWYGESSRGGKKSEAEIQFKKSLELQPRMALSEVWAMVYVRTGQLREAEASLRQIVAKYPYDGDSHLQLAKPVVDGGKARPRQGENIRPVLQTDPAKCKRRWRL